MYNGPDMPTISVALCFSALLFQGGTIAPGGGPLIDNEHTTVWDTASPSAYSHDYVAIDLAAGTAKLGKAGTKPAAHSRTVVIELKDNPASAIPNKTSYPLAFPRPGSKKLYETPKVIVWDYTWTTGVATPMHFHDKDVVVTYLKDGSLESTTPTGEKTLNQYRFGDVRFNRNNRTHTETLVKGSQRAIITEFK